MRKSTLNKAKTVAHFTVIEKDTTEAVSTTVKPKLKRNSEEEHTKLRKINVHLHVIGYQFENHLGVILLILDPIVSITLLPQQTIPARN